MLADVGPRVDVPKSETEPDRTPCLACGEMIVRGAAKCRFCGEIFDPVLKQKQRKKRKKKRSGGSFGEDMTALDWMLAIFCSGIGCIVGIVYLIQGDSRGVPMIVFSIIADFAKSFLFQVLTSL
jgi:hypothetical protein